MSSRALAFASVIFSFAAFTLSAIAQTWTPLNNTPPVSVGAMMLLTDGRILVHEEPNCNEVTGCTGTDYTAWFTLTPDITGSYVNGTWTQVASLPGGYAPLFFGSAVLPDGKVVIQGGEYQCPDGSCGAMVYQSLGALYDPVANTWTATTPPAGPVGDAQSVVLPNGTWMLADCCAVSLGDSSFPLYEYFNERNLNFTSKASAGDGKFDEFDEEGWNLLPSGEVLTVDAYTDPTNNLGTNSELYDPATNTWSSAGSTAVQLWDSGCETGNGSFEVGPAVLMPNGTVYATGASDCEAGHTAVYNTSTGAWAKGPDFPNSNAANDAPASIEINGNVVVMSSPDCTAVSCTPAQFYEWNGTTLSSFSNPANASNDSSSDGHLLVLPTGQVMFTDFTTGVEVLTSAGTYKSAWQPTITTAPASVSPGMTNYPISGTQFNGLSQGADYGNNFQDATNYPLVRIVNNSTSHVFYCRTHGHSTMAVATGSTVVSTNFDVPAGIETGPSELFVVANGIPSAGMAVTVGGSVMTSTTTTVASNANPSLVGQTVTLTATVGGSGSPTGSVSFTSNSGAIAGCTAVTLASGQAKCSSSALAAGSDTIAATYSGDSNDSGSSGSLLQIVNSSGLTASTTAVTSSGSPSTFGASVKFIATVTPAGPPTPTGTVSFTSNGSAISGCTGVTLASGSAVCTTSSLAVGTDVIAASYSGNTTYAGSVGTVSQLVNPVATAVQFVSVTPCRIVDTRAATGDFGGPGLVAAVPRSFIIPQGPCPGIPATAVAYSLNVTVIPTATLGYLTIWPAGQGQPTVSTLNSPDGRTKANAAIVPSGTTGAVSVYASNATNLLLDINGYFEAGTANLEFYPMNPPCRLADTRGASGELGGPILAAKMERDFPLQSSSACVVPSTAQAYSLNFTVIPPATGDAVGYLTVWPQGEAQPTVSTLNDPTGTTVANAAIVPANTNNGEIAVYPSAATNLLIDINGYFAASSASGLELYTVTPCRVLDTRSSGGAFSGEKTVVVQTSPCALPSTAQAYVFNATVLPTAALGYLTLWPDGESQPVVSTLNAPDGATTSNMAIVPNKDGSTDALASASTQLIMDISAYFAPAP